MNSGSFSRRSRRGNVDPVSGTKSGYGNNRKNTTRGRRYKIQGILPNRPKRLKNESDKDYQRRIRAWRRDVEPIKFVRHDKWS